jgi:hypothetical protein
LVPSCLLPSCAHHHRLPLLQQEQQRCHQQRQAQHLLLLLLLLQRPLGCPLSQALLLPLCRLVLGLQRDLQERRFQGMKDFLPHQQQQQQQD